MERNEMLVYIFILFASWFIFLYFFKKIGKKYGLEVSFPLLIWKTERGKNLINRVSKKINWKYYGNLSILICLIAMLSTTYLILRNAILSFYIPPQRAPSPRLMLGLPGINPVIPVGYGIISLAIAMVIHEFSHGILARYGGLKIKSLGLIFLIFPVGAFVEPDEGRLRTTKRIKRSRVFASGPASNIIVAAICILLLSFLSMNLNTKDGLVLNSSAFGMKRGSIISEIEGNKISSLKEFKELGLEAGNKYNIEVDSSTREIVFGAYVTNVEKSYPAEIYGIAEGSILYEINGIKIKNWRDFQMVMNNTTAYQKIEIKYFYGSFKNASIILENKYNYTKNSNDDGKGFLGISVVGLEDVVSEPDYYKNLLNPLSKKNFNSHIDKFLYFLTFPFFGLSPFPKDFADAFTCSSMFWIAYNSIYWIFWLNFALGTFNSLPIIPLDGGYIFKDGLSFLLSKSKKADKISSAISKLVSVAILIMILVILFVPYIRLIAFSL